MYRVRDIEDGERSESSLALRRRGGCRSIEFRDSDADDDVELATRCKLPEVEGSRDSKDADLNLRKGTDGGVCIEGLCIAGLRGDELLFCFPLVRNLEGTKKESYKNSPAAVAETWCSGRGERTAFVG